VIQIVRLGRLFFPFTGVLLFSFGSLLGVASGAEFYLSRFLLGLSIAFLGQLSVSYSNDFFDVEVDRYTERTWFSGGSAVLLESPELRNLAKYIALFLMGLSISLALVFFFAFSPPVSLFLYVVFGNVLGWFYSAPPLQLSYRGYSEVIVLITIGVVLPGFGYFILKEKLDFLFVVFLMPLLCYVLDFILSVESPNKEGDRLRNKDTIIVRKGRKFGFVLVAFSCVIATVYLGALTLLNLIAFSVVWIMFFSLIPLIGGLWGLIHRTEERKEATKIVSYNLVSLILFLLIIDGYLLFISTTLIVPILS